MFSFISIKIASLLQLRWAAIFAFQFVGIVVDVIPRDLCFDFAVIIFACSFQICRFFHLVYIAADEYTRTSKHHYTQIPYNTFVSRILSFFNLFASVIMKKKPEIFGKWCNLCRWLRKIKN